MHAHRYVFLDGLRGLAALMVVLFHATQHTPYPLARTAYFSVDVFFCLSGFVIAKAYAGRIASGMAFADFALRRLIRLYPMFLVGLVLGVAPLCLKTASGMSDYGPAGLATAFVLNLFFVPYLNGHLVTNGDTPVPGGSFPFNDPQWSLFFELLVNAAFFLLLPWTLRGRLRVPGIVAACGLGFAAGILAGVGNSGWGSTPSHLAVGLLRTGFGFYAGVALASLPERPFAGRRANLLAIAAVTAGFLGLCCLPSGRISFAIAIAFVIPLVYLGSRVRVGGRGTETCERLGDLSYPLYCVHYPILALVDATGYLYAGLHPLVPALLGTAASIGLALVLGRRYDLPVRAWLDRRRARRLPVAAPPGVPV